MARRRGKINPIFIVGGMVVIVLIFLLFTPAILGAASAGNDLEKYNGTSQQGNDTARIAGVVNGFLVGATSIPLMVAAYAVALLAFVAVILWILKNNR